MLEKALTGKRRYWTWVFFLLGIIGAGFVTYLWQLKQGLSITGMSRDVSWGFYISQFTYLVGVAASAVMLVIPYYLHHYKKFGKMMILGEFVAVAAVTMCLLFIIVDLGQPQRAMNVILYPTPGSILFWDMLVLNGYLFINIIVAWTALGAERQGIAPPLWIKPFIYLSIPWAISIHTVTAFLYAGLPGRHYWLTAILAARFLASAFCSGPAILVLLMLIVKKLTKFDAGKEALQALTKIIAYAMFLNVFFVFLELFTAFYSNIPGHMHSFEYLFHGDGVLVPFMWTSAVLGIISLALLIPSSTRNNVKILVPTLVMLIIATWIDKGLGLVAGGFIPNPLEHITEYFPTGFELMISLGVYATGALILTVLYKVATTVKEEAAT